MEHSLARMQSGKRRRKGDPKRAVAYMRVSTDRERQELGAAGQRAAIEAWAAREGVTIVGWLTEEVTGGASLDRRPVLLEAIATIAAEKAGILVFQRWDRLARDPVTAALTEVELQRVGGVLVSADGTGNGDEPAARLMKDVVLAVARFEKEMIRARIRAALAVKKSRGEMTGAPPFGWRLANDGKTLEPDPVERETRARLRALRESGLTMREVKAEAARLGLVGRAGTPITLSALHAVVRDVSPDPGQARLGS